MARTIATSSLFTLFAFGAPLACSSLIGVEDGNDGSGGTGASASSGASSGSGGTASDGMGAQLGSGGDGGQGTGGQETGGQGAGGAPSGGSGGGDGGGPIGGEAGALMAGAGGGGTGGGGTGGGGTGGGGTGGATSTTVEGRIVDMYDRPLGNVPVSVAGLPTELTDGDGRFSFPDAPDTYDVEFLYSSRGDYYERVYRFVGLTRRDPTLQVDRDVGEQAARIDVTTANLPAPGTGFLGATVSSPVDIYFYGDEAGPGGTVSLDYDGVDPFPTTLHALLWENAGIDSEYYGLASKSLALNDSEITDVLLDAWEPVTEMGALSGLIQAPGNPSVEVTAYLNFPDGAGIPMNTIPWNSTTGAFAVDVPGFAAAVTYSVLACARDEGYACIHKDGYSLSGTTTDIQVELPTRARLIEPQDATEDVQADTVFRWQPASDAPCSLVVINEGQWHYGLRIVTCNDEAIVGSDLVGSYFPYGEEDYWSVQSYGSYASVDEMTGPEGFFDPYYDGMHAGTLPRGKRRPVSGSLTRSEYNMIRFAE